MNDHRGGPLFAISGHEDKGKRTIVSAVAQHVAGGHHSCYPTVAQDSVFLGPDSYRFGDYILRNLDGLRNGAHVLDYGADAGVGGITAASNVAGVKLMLARAAATPLRGGHGLVCCAARCCIAAQRPACFGLARSMAGS